MKTIRVTETSLCLIVKRCAQWNDKWWVPLMDKKRTDKIRPTHNWIYGWLYCPTFLFVFIVVANVCALRSYQADKTKLTDQMKKRWKVKGIDCKEKDREETEALKAQCVWVYVTIQWYDWDCELNGLICVRAVVMECSVWKCKCVRITDSIPNW